MTLARKPTGWEWLAIGWFVGAILVCAAAPALSDWKAFFGLWPLLGWSLVWLFVLGVLLIQRNWRAAGLHGVLTALAMFLLTPATIMGAKAWDRLTFERARPTYAQIIARQSSLPDEGQLNGVAYRIERDPPARIAFLLPIHEFDDNWSAVVYDPSGQFATPRDGEGRPVVRPEQVKLWGGDLAVCDHITGHYYRCGFTWREGTPRWPQRWRPRGSSAS